MFYFIKIKTTGLYRFILPRFDQITDIRNMQKFDKSIRAATNNYFNNQLVGRLFLRLIKKKNIYCFILLPKTHSPHSVQCLSNKRAN